MAKETKEMKETKTVDVALLDVRVVERTRRQGLVDDRQYIDYLKTLPDSSSQAEYCEVTLDPARSADDRTPQLPSLTFTPVEGEE